MLRSLKDLERYKVSATDGELGTVETFLLDDELWLVRYLIVAAGGILGGRRVLVSPVSFGRADWSTRRFHLALSVDKVRKSPGVDVDQPVSRQHEREYSRYYGWTEPAGGAAGDVHLRSARELNGYRIRGSDEAIGQLADFVVDDETWHVRYLVVDVGHWWSGKNVLVSPYWTSRISWDLREIDIDMSREVIRSAPAWDPAAPVNREYEAHLYDYYGRPVYWGG